jgi:peptidoglycan/LPS O-acetylase OafA/YrhL
MIVFCLTLNLLFRGYFWIEQNDQYNLINYSILNRLVEFLFGIIVARIYLEKRQAKIWNSNLMILVGFIIAFFGRILMSSIFQDRTDIIGYFSRVLNIPILTAGYSLMIINSLNVNSLFSKMLESKFFIFIGKISYSMYLWHWLIAETISIYIYKNITSNNVHGLFITFFLSFIILIPISKMSYFLFESFYFRRKK